MILCLAFFILISIVAALIYIPTRDTKGSFLSSSSLAFFSLVIYILILVRRNLSVVLIYISLMAKDAECIFHVFSSHLYFLFWEVFTLFSHLLLDYCSLSNFFGLFKYHRYQSSDRWTVGEGLLLAVSPLWWPFSALQKCLNLMQSHLSALVIISRIIETLLRKSLSLLVYWSVSLFLTSSFKALALTFKAFDPFWVCFSYRQEVEN